MLKGVKKIGEEYADIVKRRGVKEAPRNICSTSEMDQDDEGYDVAKEFVEHEDYRDLSGYGDGARTLAARTKDKILIGVMQITVSNEAKEDRHLYIKWLLGSRSTKGGGVALIRSALEYAILERISKLKVDSAMSAVEWYRKRGFTKYGDAQHMNDKWENPIEDEEDIDCGCAMMEFRFYWD